MGYLGNSNVVQNFTPAVDYFNGNGSVTAFTLSRTVGSVFDVQAFIENVPQNPSSAFTVAGNVITFTSAPPSGTNNIYVRYTSPVVQQVKPAPGTVGPTELNSAYSLWNLSGADINYTAGKVGVGTSSPGNTFESYNGSDTQIRVRNGTTLQSYDFGRNGSTGLFNFYGNQTGFTGYVFGGVDGERMRITSAGDVGIGTSNPYKRFSVTKASSTAYSTSDFDQDYLAVQLANSTNDKATGIYFAVGSNGEAAISAVETSDGETAITFGTRGGGSRPERMRITSGGNLLVNTTTAYGEITSNAGLDPFSGLWATTNSLTTTGAYGGGIGLVDGSSGYLLRAQDNGNDFYIQGGAISGAVGGGVYLNNFATSWSSASDENVKDIIEPITNGLEKVVSLRAVIGKYKDEEEGKRHPFLIAQDVQVVLPEAVSVMNKGKENECLGLSYTDVIPLLVASIKEQQAIIEDLKTRIEILEDK